MTETSATTTVETDKTTVVEKSPIETTTTTVETEPQPEVTIVETTTVEPKE